MELRESVEEADDLKTLEHIKSMVWILSEVNGLRWIFAKNVNFLPCFCSLRESWRSGKRGLV